ncbi:unnamed protein product, partial [Staurois parvus]
MGPCTASSCCCQVQSLCMAFNFSCLRSTTLPWAPVPPPHAAARPVICHGPPYRLPHAAARPVICHGSLYGLPLLL